MRFQAGRDPRLWSRKHLFYNFRLIGEFGDEFLVFDSQVIALLLYRKKFLCQPFLLFCVRPQRFFNPSRSFSPSWYSL